MTICPWRCRPECALMLQDKLRFNTHTPNIPRGNHLSCVMHFRQSARYKSATFMEYPLLRGEKSARLLNSTWHVDQASWKEKRSSESDRVLVHHQLHHRSIRWHEQGCQATGATEGEKARLPPARGGGRRFSVARWSPRGPGPRVTCRTAWALRAPAAGSRLTDGR